ncbi:MAG: hypothetical protein IKB87_04980 [Clostridia bacterium]|nr:hypothetical protein [Clostridia bacterium]
MPLFVTNYAKLYAQVEEKIERIRMLSGYTLDTIIELLAKSFSFIPPKPPDTLREMLDFPDETKDMTAAEILNCYRNRYRAEPQVTERGIVANAINDILSQYHNQKADIKKLQEAFFKKEDLMQTLLTQKQAYYDELVSSKVDLEKYRKLIANVHEELKEAKALYIAEIATVRAEAIKEFAERGFKMITEVYNKHIFGNNDLEDEEKDAIINFSDDVTFGIDNLVKEMTGNPLQNETV